MQYIVYLTLNTKNKKIYVGVHQTVDPDRFDNYIGCGIYVNKPYTYNHPKTPFQFAVQKYGVDSFKRTILKVFNSMEDAYSLEEIIVDKEFLKRKDVYNVALGGMMPNTPRVIYQYSLVGDFIKEWDSITDAAYSFTCSPNALSNAVKFKGSSNGYFWDFEKFESLDINTYSNNSNKQSVYRYNKSGKLMDIYESIIDAADANDEVSSTIGRAIQGTYLVKDSYYSLNLYDKFEPQGLSIRGKEIHLYDIEGNYYKSFKNPITCAKEFGLKGSDGITKALKLGRLFKDYQVSLEKVDSMKKLGTLPNKARRVGRFTINNELVEEFKSITAACEIWGTSVQKVLRGQQQTCKEFIFKYI